MPSRRDSSTLTAFFMRAPAQRTLGIRRVKLETGEVQAQPLDARYFGEGITVWKNRIIQLTWQSGGVRLRPTDVQAPAHLPVHR